jgi:hypothetical protein
MLRRLWKFVRASKNREILSWLGGAATIIVTGIWVAIVYFFPTQKIPDQRPVNVQANCGGVAIGGSVIGTTITGGTTTGSDCPTKSNQGTSP